MNSPEQLIEHTDVFNMGERFVPGLGGAIELEHIHRYAAAARLLKGKRVLDLACGEGYGSRILKFHAHSVTGIDISTSAIEHAVKHHLCEGLSFLVGNGCNIPIPDDSFDAIVSFETIEHHDQHEQMLDEFRRVLKNDGILIISSPDRATYSDIPGYQNPFHVKELYQHEFELLLRARFKNVVLYGQRVFCGSAIAPLNARELETQIGQFVYPRPDGISDPGEPTPGIAAPHFLIAVASNSIPPALETTLFGPLHSPASGSIEVAELSLYPGVPGLESLFSEARRLHSKVPLSGIVQTIEVDVPVYPEGINKLRLDISDRPAVIEIYELTAIDMNGVITCSWNPHKDPVSVDETIISALTATSARWTAVGNDSRITIVFPDGIADKFSREGFVFRVTLRAWPIPAVPGLPISTWMDWIRKADSKFSSALSEHVSVRLDQAFGKLSEESKQLGATISFQTEQTQKMSIQSAELILKSITDISFKLQELATSIKGSSSVEARMLAHLDITDNMLRDLGRLQEETRNLISEIFQKLDASSEYNREVFNTINQVRSTATEACLRVGSVLNEVLSLRNESKADSKALELQLSTRDQSFLTAQTSQAGAIDASYLLLQSCAQLLRDNSVSLVELNKVAELHNRRLNAYDSELSAANNNVEVLRHKLDQILKVPGVRSLLRLVLGKAKLLELQT